MTPLVRELVAARRIARHPEITAILETMGLAAAGAPMCGVQNVVVEDGYYDPDPAGRMAIITAVF